MKDSPLYNKDMAPIPQDERSWSKWDLTAIWIGMAVCIPTYLLASYMINSGLKWFEALIIIGVANLIITIPMVLNGHAGVKYGIPFPVVGRSAFGIKGIHIAAIARAIVACGWFGVQTWIGGLAIYEIWNAVIGVESSVDLNVAKFVCFAIFWFINMYFIWKGTESIKWLEKLAAPILILIGLALISWGMNAAGGFGNVLEQSKQLESPSYTLTETGTDLQLDINPLKGLDNNYKATSYQIMLEDGSGTSNTDWIEISSSTNSSSSKNWGLENLDVNSLREGEQSLKMQLRKDTEKDFIYSSQIALSINSKTEQDVWSKIWSYLIWLTAMVGFWATMAISIADITRYASTQRDQILGQFMGLPLTMLFYSFVGIFATCAAVVFFKDVLISNDAPWEPISLIGKFDNTALVIVSQFFMLIATLSTNIAANVIAPANTFANLWPRKINFARGGTITGVIGILLCPWWILNEISGLLIAVSSILGPVLAILICDYFIIRKKSLDLNALYKVDGIYSFNNGFNVAAIIALITGVLVALSGLFIPAFDFLYKLSWFSGFASSFVVYWALMKNKPSGS
ncbi:MAG: NCS1 family nucleobase:cation symporter-1 [Chitinophagales bacterium]|nr:NCS1 family nucleobase:cation symporter-1 [Chitinophagales bacterium]